MEIARLKLRFRNQIRCRELETYKQRIRASLFTRERLPPLTDDIHLYRMPASPHKHDPLFLRAQAALRDFECNYSQGAVEHGLHSLTIEENDSSNSSQSRASRKQEEVSLDQLEFMVAVWLRAEREGQLFFNVCEGLQTIPYSFYTLMDKHLPQLPSTGLEGESGVAGRLRRLWTLCQGVMVDRLLARHCQGQLSEVERMFLCTMLTNKVIYLHRYDLLEDPVIAHQNALKCAFIFDPEADFENESLYQKIAAAFIFPSERPLPTEDSNFVQFIESHLITFCQRETELRLKDPVRFVDCAIALLQMASKMELIHAEAGSELHESIQRTAGKALEMGLAVFDGMGGDPSELKDSLMLSLLLAISKNRLEESLAHKNSIVGVCSAMIISNARSEILELWAIELLGRVGAQRALNKLQIHYTYKLHTATSEAADLLEVCLVLVCNMLAYLTEHPLA